VGEPRKGAGVRSVNPKPHPYFSFRKQSKIDPTERRDANLFGSTRTRSGQGEAPMRDRQLTDNAGSRLGPGGGA